jgi:CheY-like chemotaxis protein
MVLGRQLAAWDCACFMAADGDEALARLREAAGAGEPFEAALIGLGLPGMNGGELARAVKDDAMIARTALVLLAPLPKREEANRMLEHGFDAYLSKPVKAFQLANTLAAATAQHDSGLHACAQQGRAQQGCEAQAAEAQESGIQSGASCACRAPGRTGEGRPHVLLVDDDKVNRRLVREMLARAGYLCTTAREGAEAIAALECGRYDLVLMDCRMPGKDGYDTAAAIRRNEKGGRRIPIIAMTAEVSPGWRIRCHDAGMNGFVSKPITASTLYRLLEQHLGETPAPRQPDSVSPRPERPS